MTRTEPGLPGIPDHVRASLARLASISAVPTTDLLILVRHITRTGRELETLRAARTDA